MPSTKTQVTYLTTDGHYYRKKCTILSDHGNIADNSGGEQTHFLDERPTFVPRLPVLCRTWDEVLNFRPEPQPKIAEQSAIITEEQNSFPVTTNPFPSIKERLQIYRRWRQQGLQRALVQASKSDMNTYVGPVMLICAAVAGVVTLLIALIWAVNYLGQEDVAPPVEAALIALLGIAIPLPRLRGKVQDAKPAEPKIKVKREPVPYCERLYLYCEITNQVHILRVPFAVLAEHLDQTARFFPILRPLRFMAMLYTAPIMFALGFVTSYYVMPIAAALATGVLLTLAGAGLGWLLGPTLGKYLNPPIWIARRTAYNMEDMLFHVMHEIDEEVEDLGVDIDDAKPMISPYSHTFGLGMDADLFGLQRDAEFMVVEDDDERDAREGGGLIASNVPGRRSIPLMFYAKYIHHKIPRQDETDRFRGGNNSQKIQMTGLLVLAGCSLLILFLVIASQGG